MMLQERIVTVCGMDIYLKVLGQGTPIVFLHGGPGAEHSTFLPHIEPLAQRFSLVLYDQRGCGKSGRASSPDAYTLANEVETLEGVRQALCMEKLNLVGESWGTMLALLYATTYPERINKMLLASAIGTSSEGYQAFERELLSRITDADGARIEEISRRLETGEALLDELFAVLDPYYVYSTETLTRNSPCIRNPEVNQAMHPQILANYDVRSQLPRISHVPIQVLQGDSDMLSASYIRDDFHRYLPHVEVKEVDRCGHWVYVERSDEFLRHAESFFQ